ncbi:MAG: galactokinase [Flavobacteriaceae bacterium]|nr:galactokinase [Flavobacteriaceae bacterium]
MVVNEQKTLEDTVAGHYRQTYSSEPLMVFSPGRINLIGEHTDYNMGLVFPAAIDLGIAMAIGLSNTPYCEITALDESEVLQFHCDHLQISPQGEWQNYVLGVVAQLRKTGHKLQAFQMCFGGNLPQGSGMSSSAALENALVFSLNELFDLQLSREEMIYIAQAAEHEYVGVQCGIMDQYASMFGVAQHALLLHCKTMEVETVKMDLQEHVLVVVNSHVKHSLAESSYNDRRAACERVAAHIGVAFLSDTSLDYLQAYKAQLDSEDYQKARFVLEENQRVLAARSAIEAKDWPLLGTLLYASHQGLKVLYEVSCEEIDFLVDTAKTIDGVLGSRMMGGGFGGSTISLVHRDAVATFSNRLKHAYQNRFNLDCTMYPVKIGDGTRKL